ncbi:MAG: hypothetical protein ING25_11035 [Burkholderiales bacterium]|nr:hypothetical protein [Burkholderiales bacterium]
MILKDPNTNDTCLSDDPIDGWVEITQEELAAIHATRVVQEPAALTALQQLEADNQITQRRLRETIMLMAEAFKQITAGALDLSQIPGVAQVYAVEAQAAALRAELGGSYNTPLTIPNAVATPVGAIPASDSV